MSEENSAEGGGSSRRTVMTLGLGALVAAAGVGGYYALYGDAGNDGDGDGADSIVAELMKKGPLPDHPVGESSAPVTIIEYSSMTCPHCANFHKTILPGLKEKYIATGKARYIIREFPLNNLAVTASMLTRCVAADKYNAFVEALYDKQDVWAFGEGDAIPRLFAMAKQVGFSQETFDQCRKDQKLLDNLIAVRTRANEVFKVESTPTFFVNGMLVKGVRNLEELEKAMEPHLKG